MIHIRPPLKNYVQNPLVKENSFISMPREERDLPSYADSRNLLPKPAWAGHGDTIDCYWKAWELAFDHLRKATAENSFIANYIDTAFNNDIFMWDTTFILKFANYGRRAFDFQKTLDNFYAKQHPDGFICRQIWEDGSDAFHRHDPSSTGPNVFPWAEWEYYCMTGDMERLSRVFPVLVAFHRWMKAYRTWPNGTYWASGWGCGMDNQPRMPKEMSQDFYHGHQVWVDTTIQQVFSADLLLAMGSVLGRRAELDDLAEEREKLSDFITGQLWCEKTGFYYDMRPNRELSDFMTIGAYWALIAGLVPPERLDRFVGHLENPEEFNRPHRIPAMPANHPDYDPAGEIWVGGVWTPTNYMVLRGLTKYGCHKLAHGIALNHVENVVEVYKNTGTIWEYYAPESPAPGKNHARPNMVGWGGLPPIAVLFEYIFGIRPAPETNKLVWDVRLLEEHGIEDYPFGNGLLSLHCSPRKTFAEKPDISVKSNVPLELTLIWDGGQETHSVKPQ